jgi:membrane protease YdiL (CAAX protease family)
MKKYLAAISPRAEFLIVMGCAFGPFLLAELLSLAHPRSGPHHTGLSLLVLAGHELIAGVLLAWFLAVRGWTWEEFGLGKNSPISDAGVGVLLFLGGYAAWFLIWNIAVRLSPELGVTMAGVARNVIGGHVPLPTLVLASVINGVFEEFFVVGYAISAFARTQRSVWFCTNLSTALRLSYHLYQGPLGVLSIVPTGLIFAFWFTRTRRLWPLMFAHILMDMTALVVYGQ